MTHGEKHARSDDRWKRRSMREFCAAVLALALVLTTPALAEEFSYTCDGGQAFTIDLDGVGNGTISFADGKTAKLVGLPIGIGTHYSGEGVSFRSGGQGAIVTREVGGEVLDCVAVPKR